MNDYIKQNAEKIVDSIISTLQLDDLDLKETLHVVMIHIAKNTNLVEAIGKSINSLEESEDAHGSMRAALFSTQILIEAMLSIIKTQKNVIEQYNQLIKDKDQTIH